MRMWLLKNEGKMIASECTSLYLAFHLSHCINFCQLTLNFSFFLSFSALYVVDLKKFRRIAAGDRLRGQYQGLSQDPNSLANLDQDLPNNMIHQVAIKSLPQEWLWCETWCSTEELARAKTIDLVSSFFDSYHLELVCFLIFWKIRRKNYFISLKLQAN